MFAVTDLGKSKIFLGYDWLKAHNPSIDWNTESIVFDRCPSTCGHRINSLHVEEDIELPTVETTLDNESDDPEDRLEDGDRTFLFDYGEYLGLNRRFENLMAHDHFQKASIKNGKAHVSTPTQPCECIICKRNAAYVRAKGTTATDLAVEHAQKQAPKSFEDIVPEHYRDFKDVFDKKDFDRLPDRKPWDHAIELLPDAQPVSCKAYPMAPKEQKALDEFLEENLRSGRIRPSKSPWASPFFFVKKKDGSLRPVQDYRKLNERTIKNRYPLPLISEMINLLKNAEYFTKFDVRWGFNNIRIKEGDEEKAAFLTNRGLYEPLVMFFGLTNSPATFQLTMYTLLKHLILAGKVMVYMDDILVFSNTLEDHRQTVREVLQILRENKLYLKPEKCDFEKTKIDYLGMIIWKGHVQMDPVKVQGVATWPEPECKKDVQSFLGFCNFYRRFIRDYGRIAKPLTSLTGKVDWTWEDVQKSAFLGLKNAITTAPVLILPDENSPFRVECDASDYALGAVLSQERDGKWHPVAFLSKAMTDTERNYEIYDKELLAVMTALAEWRHFLMGSKHTFEVWNDHKNLEYFRKPQKLNRRQARWVTELADYDYTLHHKPGKQMAKADLLSRRSDHDHGKSDNTDVVLLKPEHFRAHSFNIEGLDEDIITQIKEHYDAQDTAVVKALTNKEKNWNDDGELITWEHRIYVPRSARLREKIIRLHHDGISVGHPGRYKTQELITRNYWWPRIQADVKSYVEGCETCQRTKVRHGKPTAPLQPNAIPNGPWETITVDMIGPLPESQGHDAILVIVDWFSKEIIAIPTQTELTSEGWAREYITHVYAKHGLSCKVISD